MRRIESSGLLLVLVLLAGPGLPVAAESNYGEEHKHKPVYQATVHKDGQEQDRKFDLTQDAQAAELTGLLKSGEVEHLKLDKPVNILAIQWDLGLWTLVVFLLLLWILRRSAWQPMLEGLQKREHNIQEAIDEANKAREEAQKVRAQLQAEMDNAQNNVREILEEARRDAQHTSDDLIAKARTEIQAERDRLRREIAMARDQAIQELWKQTADLATLISSKAIRRQMTAEDHRHLIDEALNELHSSVAERRQFVRGSN